MSGCGLNHCDIGGYTSLFDNLRTKEVFIRWTEMAAFMPVMRTHEGNRPDTNFQYYDDEDTMKVLAKLVKAYKQISPYTRSLVKENAKCGIPVMRPLFVEYEDDASVYDMQYEYMFGPEILVAPVYLEGKDSWEVYLPEGEWIHIFTGKEFAKGKHVVDAPLGQTPAFYKKNSQYADLFASVADLS